MASRVSDHCEECGHPNLSHTEDCPTLSFATSPSKNFATLGTQIKEGLLAGMKQAAENTAAAMVDMSEAMKGVTVTLELEPFKLVPKSPKMVTIQHATYIGMRTTARDLVQWKLNQAMVVNGKQLSLGSIQFTLIPPENGGEYKVAMSGKLLEPEPEPVLIQRFAFAVCSTEEKAIERAAQKLGSTIGRKRHIVIPNENDQYVWVLMAGLVKP